MLCELKVRCKKCGQDYALSELPLDKNGRFGVAPRCRECRAGRQRTHRTKIRALKLPPPEQKRCIRCGEVKPKSDFYKNAGAKDGLYGYCRPCDRARRTQPGRKRVAAVKLQIPGFARCSQCKQTLPSAAFSVNAKRKNGLNCYCRSCLSIRHSARAYSISLEQARELRSRTECECCGAAISGGEVNIDHCHATGAVRGALCSPCNFMLGAARDRPEILRAGADYLESTARVAAIV